MYAFSYDSSVTRRHQGEPLEPGACWGKEEASAGCRRGLLGCASERLLRSSSFKQQLVSPDTNFPTFQPEWPPQSAP
jgi:hypothetical protein